MTLVAAHAVAGAALALWTHVRFPRLAPTDWRLLAVHLLLAMVVLRVLLGPAVSAITPLSGWTLAVAVVGVLLPALTYALLAGIWFLQYTQRLLGAAR